MFRFDGHHGAVTHRVHPGARAAGLALCTLLLVAGCAGPGSTSAAPSSSLPPATSSAPTTTVPPTTTTTTEQPGWTPVSTINGAIAVDERSVVTPGGADVQLIRFRAGRARFDLHVGSMDPPTGGAVLPADAGSALSSAELGSLLGAFNGGFQISTGAGGFEVDGHVLVPLVAGRASFVIDASGAAHVGVWGSGLPAPGEQVVSVRQNLVPLVLGSAPAPDVGSVAAWGATLGGVPNVARSAVGEDAAGNIVYAGSMAAPTRSSPATRSGPTSACGPMSRAASPSPSAMPTTRPTRRPGWPRKPGPSSRAGIGPATWPSCAGRRRWPGRSRPNWSGPGSPVAPSAARRSSNGGRSGTCSPTCASP